METYCVKCTKNTKNLNSKIFKTKKIVDYLSNQNVMTVELKSQDL